MCCVVLYCVCVCAVLFVCCTCVCCVCSAVHGCVHGYCAVLCMRAFVDTVLCCACMRVCVCNTRELPDGSFHVYMCMVRNGHTP